MAIKNKLNVFRLSLVSGVISLVYLIFAFLPSILYHVQSPSTSFVRELCGAICHQKPSRCFWIFDYPCGLCVKCMGFYIGIVLVSLLYIFFDIMLNLYWAIVFALFLVVILLDSWLGLVSYQDSSSVICIFILAVAGGAGLLSLIQKKVSSGGKFMLFVMKHFIFLVIVFVLTNVYGFSKAFGQDGETIGEPGSALIIPGGTGVVLQLVGGVTTKESREGDAVPLYVVSPVRVKGVIVIRGGTPGRGLISMARAASSWGGAGELCIEAKSVQAIDGTEILVSGITSRRGETSHGTSAAVAVGTGVLCLPLALTGAAVKGEEGRVMPGFEFVARTLNDQIIHIPSESELQSIQKQQDEVLKIQRSNAELKAQQLREEEARKKKTNSSSADH